MKAVVARLLYALPLRKIRHWLDRIFPWRWFRGNYASWEEARSAARGYEDGLILKRVLDATRAVKAGNALWERDGTAFHQPQVNAPLLRVLGGILVSEGRLDVVDFGGGLGSTWWQHRSALPACAEVYWRVVEQPHYVAAGREFANATLSFHNSIGTVVAENKPSVILLSSVLPYLEVPEALLEEITCLGFRHVIIDRTPFVRNGTARLAVQFTPPELGGGSYPVWLFDREHLLKSLQKKYELMNEWPALDVLASDVEHRGFYFRRKEA